MRRNQKRKSFFSLIIIEPNMNQQNFELFCRIWYVFLLSHIGYLGICIELIWNYLPLFFVILRVYTLYSNFVCISSIMNNRLEKVVAIGIIVLGCLASNFAVQHFMPMESISNQSTSSVLTFLTRSFQDIQLKLGQTAATLH
jgi:hypothetical protein